MLFVDSYELGASIGGFAGYFLVYKLISRFLNLSGRTALISHPFTLVACFLLITIDQSEIVFILNYIPPFIIFSAIDIRRLRQEEQLQTVDLEHLDIKTAA